MWATGWIETCTPMILTTKFKTENDKIIHYNDKNDRNTELESCVVYMRVKTNGSSLCNTGAKIHPLRNALKM